MSGPWSGLWSKRDRALGPDIPIKIGTMYSTTGKAGSCRLRRHAMRHIMIGNHAPLDYRITATGIIASRKKGGGRDATFLFFLSLWPACSTNSNERSYGD